MNARLKHAVEQGIVASGAPAVLRRRRRHDTIVLAYHNVVPHGSTISGDTSLHIRQADFAAQLDALIETHEIVPLASIFDDKASQSRPRSRPRAVITFDDAYAGALTAGVGELAIRHVPATMFVTPALLGRMTWWDSIADPELGAVRLDRREHALTVLRGDSELVLQWAGADPGALGARVGARIGTEQLLNEAASSPGLTLASHTWSHKNLSAIEGDELDSELALPAAWLRQRFATAIPWISYPYGLYSPATRDAVASAGYVGALRVEGGWIRAGASIDRLALPRVNIPAGLSLAGFRLRTAGIGSGW